jgi:hypothetical protein
MNDDRQRVERCETCKWWRRNQELEQNDTEGTCHRYPPRRDSCKEDEDWDFDLAMGYSNPVTYEYNFCGEWTPKKPVSPTPFNELPKKLDFDKLVNTPALKKIGEFNLNVRIRKGLRRHGICSIDDLCRCTPEMLLEIKNFGTTSLNTVIEALTAIGRNLASTDKQGSQT